MPLSSKPLSAVVCNFDQGRRITGAGFRSVNSHQSFTILECAFELCSLKTMGISLCIQATTTAMSYDKGFNDITGIACCPAASDNFDIETAAADSDGLDCRIG